MGATLIVNADDYGFTPGVSAGIRAANTTGIVTSTSVLIVAPSARSDLREAQASCPNLGIGVHLTLTGGWRPIIGAEQLTSLTTRRGRFPSSADLPAVVARAKPEEVFAEWRAQIEAVLDAGVTADHLNAHHHVCYRSRALTEVFLRLAAEYRLPVRLPVTPPSQPAIGGLIPSDELFDLAATFALAHPHQLLAEFSGARADSLFVLLQHLRPGDIAELMCHPGRVDWRLRWKSSYTRERELELAALTDERVQRWVDARDMKLATFEVLAGDRGANVRSRSGR